MTITLYTGKPGSGKTSSAVEMIRTEFKGRRVLVDGIRELSLPHEVIDARRWHEVCKPGDVIVVDEAQRLWRPMAAGAAVPPELAALEIHRSTYSVDIVILTQHPRLIHTSIRRLARHVHLRDAGRGLGRWMYEWEEVSEDVDWANCVNKRQFFLPKEAFQHYKSADEHTTVQRRLPRALVLGVLAVLGTVLAVGFAWRAVAKSGAQAAATPPAAASAPAAPASDSAAPAAPAAANAAVLADVAASQASRAVGCIAMGERCRCFDSAGVVLVVHWDACQFSARSLGGLVPLEVRAAADGLPRAPAAALASLAPASGPGPVDPSPTVLGLNAGDIRARAARTPVNDYR